MVQRFCTIRVKTKCGLRKRSTKLVARVLVGVSNKEVAFTAGIDDGLLYQWVRCYKMKGYQGLVEQRKGRPPKEPDMKKKIVPAELTPSEREEMIRLRAENERLRAEIAVVKNDDCLERREMRRRNSRRKSCARPGTPQRRTQTE